MENPDVENEKSVEKVRKQFRISNKWVYLTYPQLDVDKKAYRKWIREKTSSAYYIENILIAKEKHEDGNPHAHVLITYNKRFQTTNCSYFDYEGKHPHFGDKYGQMPKNAHEYAKCARYLTKEDKKVKVDSQIIDCANVWDSSSLAEAMLKVNNPLNAKAIWDAKPQGFTWDPIELPEQNWYKDLEEILDDENPLKINWYRKIVWIRCKDGDSGKTVWGLKQFQDQNAWYMNHIGQVRDLALNIKLGSEAGWDGKILYIDLPRDAKDYKSIYSCMEMLKSGLITQTKYMCGLTMIPFKLKVVVLANFWPDVSKNSHDRWLLQDVEFDNEDVSHLVKRNVHDVRNDDLVVIDDHY